MQFTGLFTEKMKHTKILNRQGFANKDVNY